MSAQIKTVVPEIVEKYAQKSDAKALFQVANTLIPYFVLFYLCIVSFSISLFLFLPLLFLLSLFVFRTFILMHDCGHWSLFKSRWANEVCGVITGVLIGLPQYVWAKHHNFHHANNGNWEKYRGPLNIMSVEKYKELPIKSQKIYCYSRCLAMAPLGGFLYFILNPRVNWVLGIMQYVFKVSKSFAQNPKTPFKETMQQDSSYWNTAKEFYHMTLNNILLLAAITMAVMYFGALEFFTVYIISLSLAGGTGIIVFTIQHNFKDSYASDSDRCDYYEAAIRGTSFLVLPKILNWFSASIGYHHVHHLSAGIPNYNLVKCHEEFAHLFTEVTQVRIKDIPVCKSYMLWDQEGERLVTVESLGPLSSA